MSEKTYTMPSGLGGAFTVRIVADLEQQGHVIVQVHMPRNPDWHGYQFTARRDQLKPVQERAS